MIRITHLEQQLLVLASRPCRMVLVQPGADHVEGLVVGQGTVHIGFVHQTHAARSALPLVANEDKHAGLRYRHLDKLESVL